MGHLKCVWVKISYIYISFEVIASGVEREDRFEKAIDHGCDS